MTRPRVPKTPSYMQLCERSADRFRQASRQADGERAIALTAAEELHIAAHSAAMHIEDRRARLSALVSAADEWSAARSGIMVRHTEAVAPAWEVYLQECAAISRSGEGWV